MSTNLVRALASAALVGGLQGCAADTMPVSFPVGPPVEPAVIVPVFEHPGGVVFAGSVDARDGVVTYAVEHAFAWFARPAVSVVQYTPRGRSVQRLSAGRLAPGIAHLPVVLAGVDGAWVLAKSDIEQPRATVEGYWVGEGAPAEGPFPLRVEPAGHRAGRMQIVEDDAGALHVCWRGTDPEGEEDVFGLVGSDLPGLAGLELSVLSGEADVLEDHCDMAFDPEGTRYTVLHRATSGGEGVVLQIDDDPTDGVPDQVSPLPLPAEFTGADFPTIAGDAHGLVVLAVAPVPERDQIAIWSCEGGCGDVARWQPDVLDPPGEAHVQARVLAVRGHRFAFYKTLGEETEDVEWSVRCRADDVWHHRGRLLPDVPAATAFTAVAGGSPRTVAHDPTGDRLHAIVLEQEGLVIRAHGWSIPVSSVCSDAAP